MDKHSKHSRINAYCPATLVVSQFPLGPDRVLVYRASSCCPVVSSNILEMIYTNILYFVEIGVEYCDTFN